MCGWNMNKKFVIPFTLNGAVLFCIDRLEIYEGKDLLLKGNDCFQICITWLLNKCYFLTYLIFTHIKLVYGY
jgi:hypothetical protein